MIFFIVSTVMCVAYIIYSNNKQAEENNDADYYVQMSTTLKKANDSLINTQKTDTGNIYIIQPDSLAKLKYDNNVLPDSVRDLLVRGGVKKLKLAD